MWIIQTIVSIYFDMHKNNISVRSAFAVKSIEIVVSHDDKNKQETNIFYINYSLSIYLDLTHFSEWYLKKIGVHAQFNAIWFTYRAKATRAVASKPLPAATKSRYTKQDAYPIPQYITVQTGANTYFGGFHDGWFNELYHGLILALIILLPKYPPIFGKTTAATIFKHLLVFDSLILSNFFLYSISNFFVLSFSKKEKSIKFNKINWSEVTQMKWQNRKNDTSQRLSIVDYIRKWLNVKMTALIPILWIVCVCFVILCHNNRIRLFRCVVCIQYSKRIARLKRAYI